RFSIPLKIIKPHRIVTAGVIAIIGTITLPGYQFILAVIVNVCPGHSMILRFERINRMFYPVSFSLLIYFLFIPIQAIAMSLPYYQIIFSIFVDIFNKNRYTGSAQVKFFMKYPL